MADEARVKELVAVIEKKTAHINEGMKSIKIEGENVEISPETFAEMKKARDEITEIKGLVANEYIDEEMKSFMSGFKPTDVSEQMSVAMRAAAAGNGAQQMKSLGQAFIDSTEFKDFKPTGQNTMHNKFELNAQDVTRLGTFDKKDVYNALGNHTFTHGFGSIQFDPLVPRGQRPTRVRDLFPVATTNSNLIDFFRVLGFAENGGDGGADVVADRTGTAPNDVFGLKPKSNLQFMPDQAPVRTIAHWEAAHRNVIDDEPQLRSTIDNELLYGLALREDAELINGDGTGDHLLGILNQPNTQAYAQTNTSGAPTELKSDALRRAATKAILAYYPPTGYVLNPLDWEDIELQKGGDTGSGADGDGQYMLVTNISIGAAQTVWRQPVVETSAMPEGTFVTGAWGIGAQLYDRQQANVRITESHADFFVRNAIAILVEERLAFAMKRPESFVIGTFFN